MKLVKQLSLCSLLIISGLTLTACNQENPEPVKDNGIALMDETEQEEVIQRSGYSFEDMEQHGVVYEDGKMMLILYGSSSCKPTPESVSDVDGVLNVEMKEYSEACTADYGPTIWSVTLPEGYPPKNSEDSKVTLVYDDNEIMITSSVAYEGSQ